MPGTRYGSGRPHERLDKILEQTMDAALGGGRAFAQALHRRAVAHSSSRYRRLFGDRTISVRDIESWLDDIDPGWRGEEGS